jgi:hypothetical protein
MYSYIIKTTVITLFLLSVAWSQEGEKTEKGLGFYFLPEYSAMFLKDHIGNAIGYSIGLSTPSRKFDFGVRYYGRSGPINLHQEYDLVLPDGQTYKGKSILKLAGDHGYLGFEVGYNHKLVNRLSLRASVSFGQLGAGFYLQDDDRETPDGRRVNEWENELQDGSDAGFGLASEVGLHLYYQVFPNIENIAIGTGAYYTNTYGYSSFIGGDNFFNNKVRAFVGLRLGY